MNKYLMLVALTAFLLMNVKTLDAAEATTPATPDLVQVKQGMLAKAPGPVAATLRDGQEARPTYANVTYQLRMPLQPVPRDYGRRSYGPYDDFYYYGYIPGDYSREGFLTEPGNWWIGNQPYLPYYGYNPPTTDGYYPPYAYNNYSSGYGYGGGYSGRTGNSIVPAPPLASPPAFVPPFIQPVAPAPLRIRSTGHGFVTERDPNFQLFFVPQPPNYLTTGSAIYPVPQTYYPFTPFPFLGPWR